MDQKTSGKKKVFRIPASWEMYGFAEIEASSEQEAIDIANTAFFNHQPTFDMFDGHYVDESFQIDYNVLEDN